MKILDLTMLNWMNVENAHLPFTDGINLLFGDNGQGKSAVFEAIAFMLVEHKRGETWKDYIRKGAKSFELQMVLQLSEIETDVMAFHYTGSKSKGSVDRVIRYGESVYSNSDAQIFLQKMFDQDMIKNASFAMQDRVDLSAMLPSDRRNIFKKIFNSDFPEIIEKITIDQKVIDTSVIQLKSKVELLQGKQYKVFRIIEVDESELEALRKELQNSQASEVEKEKFKLYSDRLRELNSKQMELNKLIQNKDSHMKVMETYKTQLESVRGELQTTFQRKGDLDNDLVAQKMLVDQHVEEEKTHKLSVMVSEVEALDKTLVDRGNEIAIQIGLLDSYIEARKKGLCEKCGAKYTTKDADEYEKQKKEKNETLLSLQIESSRLKEKIKSYQLKCAEWTAQLYKDNTELIRLTTERDKIIVRHKTAEDKLKEVKDTLLPREQEFINSIDSNIIGINEKISDLSKWCEENKIEAKSSTRDSSAIQKDINGILERIQRNAVESEMNEKTLKEKEADQKDLAEFVLKLNELQLKSKNFDVVKKIYEVDFPGYINLQACQILQDYMNEFFKGTKDNFQVLLQQDKKGINFFYKAGEEPEWNSAKMVSGFETSLMTLGFKCAVAYAYGSEFVILDEPDAKASEENAMKFFKTLTNIGGFKQLFAVTHRWAARDYLIENGANVYEVTKGTFQKSY